MTGKQFEKLTAVLEEILAEYGPEATATAKRKVISQIYKLEAEGVIRRKWTPEEED